MTSSTVLSIRNLSVTFHRADRAVRAVRGLDLDIASGTIHGLVGESGSGKSVTARAVLGLLDDAEVAADSIRFKDRELFGLPETELRELRGAAISMVFQEPARYLNPAFRIGTQIVEMIRVHRRSTRDDATERARELLGLVGLGAGDRVLRAYPHELSGGMKQRAMIAMALSCGPSLLIADEPTTALDVTIQRQILELLRTINRELGMAVLLISHDLGVVHDICNLVSVIYSGKIVEHGTRETLFGDPLHPYTRLLLASIPDPDRRGTPLRVIPGTVPDAEAVPPGCSFHPRCPFAEEECTRVVPELRRFGETHLGACHLIGRRSLDVGAAERPR